VCSRPDKPFIFPKKMSPLCVCVCVPPPLSHGWIPEVCDQWDDFLKLFNPALSEVHNLPVLVLKEHTHTHTLHHHYSIIVRIPLQAEV